MEELYGIMSSREEMGSLFRPLSDVNNLSGEQMIDPSWTRPRSYSPQSPPPTSFLQGGFWSSPQSQFQACGPDVTKKPLYSSVLVRGGAVSTEDVSCTSSSASNVSLASSTMMSVSALKRNPARYKTELCRPFQDRGNCQYGDKCQFAHGPSELRSAARHPRYKTDLCRTYHSIGFCPYGPRCHFIHDELVPTYSAIANSQLTQNGPQLNKPTSIHSRPPTSIHSRPPTSIFSPELFDQLPLSAVQDLRTDFELFGITSRSSETSSPEGSSSPFQTDENEDSNPENLTRLPVFSQFQQ